MPPTCLQQHGVPGALPRGLLIEGPCCLLLGGGLVSRHQAFSVSEVWRLSGFCAIFQHIHIFSMLNVEVLLCVRVFVCARVCPSVCSWWWYLGTRSSTSRASRGHVGGTGAGPGPLPAFPDQHAARESWLAVGAAGWRTWEAQFSPGHVLTLQSEGPVCPSSMERDSRVAQQASWRCEFCH